MADVAPTETFLLVDGENIDATLGGSLLGRRPAPEERPRWDRVRDYARRSGTSPSAALFFLNGSGNLPMSFVQALTALEYRPVLLSGPPEVKVVDVAIQRTLEALAERGRGDVLLASHDGDFAPQLAALLATPAPARRRARLPRAGQRARWPSCREGLELYDLEDDVGAFTVTLPRIARHPDRALRPLDAAGLSRCARVAGAWATEAL